MRRRRTSLVGVLSGCSVLELPATLASLWLLASLLISASNAQAQEQSVRPGINKGFKNPDVQKYIGLYEREGREVYDQRRLIATACRIKPGMAVADIGAGTGLYTRLFSPLVGPKGHVYAVDISKRFIEHIEGAVSTPSDEDDRGSHAVTDDGLPF